MNNLFSFLINSYGFQLDYLVFPGIKLKRYIEYFWKKKKEEDDYVEKILSEDTHYNRQMYLYWTNEKYKDSIQINLSRMLIAEIIAYIMFGLIVIGLILNAFYLNIGFFVLSITAFFYAIILTGKPWYYTAAYP